MCRPFTAQFDGYKTTEFSPGFQCYQEAQFKQKTFATMPDNVQFGHLYPRGHAAHIASFGLEYPDAENVTLNPTARVFGNFFHRDRVTAKAQAMLYQCLLPASAGCGCSGPNAAQLLTAYEAGVVTAGVLSGGVSALSQRLAADIFGTPVWNSTGMTAGTFSNSLLDAADIGLAKRECLDSAFAQMKAELARPFDAGSHLYTMYIDPRMPPEAVWDAIDFTNAHGWVDSMTRHIIISFSNYNPTTNTFTSSRIKCDLEIGGRIACKQSIEVLRVGHYQVRQASVLPFPLPCLVVLRPHYLP
eukprot:SAG22_NODE_3938_length_1461_cov_0.983113_1_plen_300_part_10